MTTFTPPAHADKRAAYLIRTFTDPAKTADENYRSLIAAAVSHTDGREPEAVLRFAEANMAVTRQLGQLQGLVRAVLKKSGRTPASLQWAMHVPRYHVLGIFTGGADGARFLDLAESLTSGAATLNMNQLLRFTVEGLSGTWSAPAYLLTASQGAVSKWVRGQVRAEKVAEQRAAATAAADDLARAKKKFETARAELAALEAKSAA